MRNGNGSHKNGSEYRKCKTPGCTCTGNRDTGYCFACEIEWKLWTGDLENWLALRKAAEQVGARR